MLQAAAEAIVESPTEITSDAAAVSFNLVTQVQEMAVAFAPRLGAAIGVFILFLIGGKLLMKIIHRMGRSNRIDDELSNFLGRSAKVGMLLFGAVSALGTLGIDIGALIAGLGLTGFALGFAFKDTISNVLAGIMVIIYKPFDQDDIKIAKTVAAGFNESLYSALLKKAGGRYDFFARRKLEALIRDLRETGAWEAADGNPINALMRSATNIDVLIEGRIRITAQYVVLTYTALGMDGRVLALTDRKELKLSRDDAKITRPTMSLDRAIRTAAEHSENSSPNTPISSPCSRVTTWWASTPSVVWGCAGPRGSGSWRPTAWCWPRVPTNTCPRSPAGLCQA